MINEVLFMEIRVFSEFLQKFHIKPKDANRMFERYGIWKYIEECYDVLHMSGDEYVMNDIESILRIYMSRIKNGMLLFHGSYTAVEKIDLTMCNNGKDFGRGFYLTSDINQARSFIRSSVRKAQNTGYVTGDQDYGYISTFRYHEPKDGIEIYEFPTTDREWLWFIAQNRRERLAGQLKPKLDPVIFSSEIIIGKVANDKTNATITAYIGGLYGDAETDEAVNDTIKRLMPDVLEDQFCFLTEKAVSCLKFLEARRYVI